MAIAFNVRDDSDSEESLYLTPSPPTANPIVAMPDSGSIRSTPAPSTDAFTPALAPAGSPALVLADSPALALAGSSALALAGSSVTPAGSSLPSSLLPLALVSGTGPAPALRSSSVPRLAPLLPTPTLDKTFDILISPRLPPFGEVASFSPVTPSPPSQPRLHDVDHVGPLFTLSDLAYESRSSTPSPRGRRGKERKGKGKNKTKPRRRTSPSPSTFSASSPSGEPVGGSSSRYRHNAVEAVRQARQHVEAGVSYLPPAAAYPPQIVYT